MTTVGKALDILEAILKNKGEVGLADLAKMTGLNRTTVHRIISILVKRDYLYQRSKGEKYSLGLKFFQYSDITYTASSIKDQALPYLQNLCNEISETVNMAILDGVTPVGITAIAAERILRVVKDTVKISHTLPGEHQGQFSLSISVTDLIRNSFITFNEDITF